MDEIQRKKLDAYYTPEEIAINMAYELDPPCGSVILDPMCGSGKLFEILTVTYPHRDLKFIGFDIDKEALELCQIKFDKNVHTEYKDIVNIDFNTKYGADLIIMNPCFHYQERCLAIKYALETFDKGVMYVPFESRNPIINVLDFKELHIHEYDKTFLERAFDCDIKYRQGYISWEKQQCN